MILIFFITGFVLCYLVLWPERQEKLKVVAELRDDFRKLLNEFSVRTGGRKIYVPEKVRSTTPNEHQESPRGEFAIMTPSMAEEMVEEYDDTPQMSEADMEYLRQKGMIQ